MKAACALVLFLIIFYTAAEVGLPLRVWQSAIHNCTNDTVALRASIATLRNKIYTDDRNVKCILQCIMSTVGLMKDDGSLDINGVQLQNEANREHLRTVVNACEPIMGGETDLCHRAYLFIICEISDRIQTGG